MGITDGVTKDSVSVRLVMLAIIVTINVNRDCGEIIVEKNVTAVKMQAAIMQLDNAYAELVILDLAVKWSVRQVSPIKTKLIKNSKNKKGTWGEGCTNVCQCNWSNTESCDPVNGQCVCKNGFTGDECSQGQF